MNYTFQLGQEESRCYAIRLLDYEMSRYHLRKLDFHRLIADAIRWEFREKAQMHLIADNDSYSKFDLSAADKLYFIKEF